MTKLTKAIIKSLPTPTGSAKIHYDDALKGFGVRVTPAGTKTFVLRYIDKHGAERKIGVCPVDKWDLDPAREEAKRLLAEMRVNDRDPLAERQAVRDALTVNDVLDQYLEGALYMRKAESTKRTDIGRINRHLRPLLGEKYVTELSRDDVERAFADIREGKTRSDMKTERKRGRSIVQGGDGAARKSIRLLSAALRWGVEDKRIIESNPAVGVDTGSDGQREQILRPEDYAAMFDALDELEAEKAIPSVAADAIRVVALTGARRGEIAGLRREYVDLGRGVITLPPARHKTGKSTGKPRKIGLPAVALAIIGTSKGDVVFPIEPDRLSKTWNDVAARAELEPGITLHSLRHSLASHMAMGGAQAPDIMTALGHSRMATTERYIHFAENRLKEIAEGAASVALAAMKPKRTTPIPKARLALARKG